MKLFISALALALALAAAGQVKADKHTDPGYFFNNNERLGHFAVEPFTDLYKAYAVAFVKPNFPDRKDDDYRNYVPSGEECMTYLTKFRIDDYQLRDVDDYIVMDACLGYVFTSENHEADSQESTFVASNLPVFQNDETLKSLYEDTKVNEFPHEAQVCIGTLLLDVVRVKKQFSGVRCNNHWIQAFNNFGACHKSIPEEFRVENGDSYMKLLYDLLKKRGLECFLAEIHSMNVQLRTKYLNNPFNDYIYKLSPNPLKGQQSERFWPKTLKNLLSAVQGTKSQINLREVADILRGISIKNVNFTNKFLKNMANYATEYMKPKEKSKAHQTDPSGMARYEAMVDELCLYFRSSTNPKYYDYAKAFIRLVTMLQYPEIYGITTKYFVTKILNKSWESGAIYLSASSCNILAYTTGILDIPEHNSELHYKVAFKPTTTGMILWPDAGYY